MHVYFNQWDFCGFFPKYDGSSARRPPYPRISVLGMDILSRLIKKAVEGNFLSSCKIGGRGEEEEQELSHLQYADDTLLFCKE